MKSIPVEGIAGLRPPVMWFANEMERQLQENDYKAGWSSLSAKWMLNRLKQEVRELERAIIAGKEVVEEAADVANFAMMIADNYTNGEEECE